MGPFDQALCGPHSPSSRGQTWVVALLRGGLRYTPRPIVAESVVFRLNERPIRGILLSADALPTPTTDASEVAPDKRDFAKRRRAAGHRRHRHGDPPPLGLSRLTCPLRWARPAVTAKMRHHQRLQGHALRRCSAGVERDCRISVLWTPPATQTCTVVHV